MQTLGIDLSAGDQNTWAAAVDWQGPKARLISLDGNQSDDALADAAENVEIIGIDCPLGWPDGFVEFVAAHRDSAEYVPTQGLDRRRAIVYRETDRVVLDQLDGAVKPLSVAADKLGLVAIRCAGLLGTLAARELVIDRTGARGAVAEVYPAASLQTWGFSARKYKRSENRDGLAALVSEFLLKTDNWLDVGDHRETLAHTDDAFDALIASLTARAVRCGLTQPVPEDADDHVGRYGREGWIHVPVADSLGLLSAAASGGSCRSVRSRR